MTECNEHNRRELPSYSITEASHYLTVPQSTIRDWVTGRHSRYNALVDAASFHPVTLSFFNLIELHILSAIRRDHQIKMPKIREAINYLMKEFDSDHPLLSKELETDGLNIFIELYGKLINISEGRQTAMREVLGAALRRIERDLSGIPVKLFPYTRNVIQEAPRLIVIDPQLAFGRPVIAGTGLSTEIIAERYKAGESMEELAKDYEREEKEIEEAIRCELSLAA